VGQPFWVGNFDEHHRNFLNYGTKRKFEQLSVVAAEAKMKNPAI
jgi:hypothetical protein